MDAGADDTMKKTSASVAYPECNRVEDTSSDETVQAAREKALVRRIDLFLMPILWLMYLFSYADRTNLANAKIAGLMTDLHLSSNQYSLSIVVYSIPYVLFQIPSNLVLARTRPSLYLGATMTLWGAITCCTAAVKSYGALLAVRFVLGALEASYAPGVALLLSSWYKRDEQAKRFCIFYSAAVVSGALGSIVAGAITGSLKMAHGIAGWRWLFIIEGSATVFVAVISVFLIPDFPATSRRLSSEERLLAVERLRSSNMATPGAGSAPLGRWKAVRDALSNWRTWLFTIAYVAISGGTTMAYFYPTLVAGLGYTAHMAQYMVIPIYAAALVAVLALGWLGDAAPRYRGLIIAGSLGLAMSCSITVCAVYNFTARYVLLVFMASGLLAANAVSLSYGSSTLGAMPPETRGVAFALINAMAAFSQIYGAYLFPSHDAPTYVMAFSVISALCAVGLGVNAALYVLVRKYPLSLPSQG